MSRRRRIYEGKAKVLYEGPEPGTLIQHFKDDATDFNAKKHEVIEGKGVLNNRISEYLFQRLNDIGVPTHFIRRLNMREQLIREVEMIPLSVAVRNVAAGSLAKRLGIEEGTQLPRSIIEFYYKNEQLNDPMVSEEHITAFGWATPQEIDDIMALAIRVNDFLCGLFLGVGIRLVDFKMECGRLWENDLMRIVVADEISPDSCRLWDIKSNDKLDKDRFRRDLGGLLEAYTDVAQASRHHERERAAAGHRPGAGEGLSTFDSALSKSQTSWPGLSRPSRFMGHGRAMLVGMAGTSPAMTWRGTCSVASLARCCAAWMSCFRRRFASAQDYPTRPVKIVVPFGAGGGTDALARFIAHGLEQRLGQPFIIENRGGAGTTLGATMVANAEPDGYTIMLGTASTFAAAPGLYKHLAYDPTKDFSPIMLLATVPFVLTVNPVARRSHGAGADRARQAQARRADVRHGGRRLGASHVHGTADEHDRHRHEARAVSRRRSGHQRCRRRPCAGLFRRRRAGGAVDQVGPSHGAGRHHHDAHRQPAGRADAR